MVAITGNTFAIKTQLKALGGRWDGRKQCWLVPDDKADRAWELVGGKPAPVETVERSWAGNTATLTTGRTGKPLVIVTGPWGRGDSRTVLMVEPEAAAEFRRLAAQADGDFDGEASFGEWFQYVFTHRADVRFV